MNHDPFKGARVFAGVQLGFFKALTEQRPNLFSNVPVFLSGSAMAEMCEVVEAIETTAQLPGYREAVLA